MIRFYNKEKEIYLKDYNAQLLKFALSPASTEQEYEWSGPMLTPLMLRADKKFSEASLTIFFEGKNEKMYLELINLLTQFEAREKDGITYMCYMQSVSQTINIPNVYREIECELLCTAWGSRHVIPLDKTSRFFYVGGALETEAVIIFENNGEMTIDAQCGEYEVKNMQAGERVTIDGVKKIVHPAFDRVELTRFPRLKPGRNNLEIVGDADITIEYRERYG